MKILLGIILSLLCAEVSAISFREVPLNKLINESEYIYIGEVVNISKTNSIIQADLKNGVNLTEPHCGACTEMATFVLEKSIKGQINKDTLLIPFYSNPYLILPGFQKNQKYILFLNKLGDKEFYVKTDPRFGAKSSELAEYSKLITEYLILKSPEEKRKWVLDLCIDPKLSNQGMYNFKNSDRSQFSKIEQQFLRSGLMKMNFDNNQYKRLLELVSKFGNNDGLKNKCFERLAMIKEGNVYEGLDLMQAIRNLDHRLIYDNMINEFIDGFGHKSTNEKRLEIITYFLKERK